MGPNSDPRGGSSLSIILTNKKRRNKPLLFDASISAHMDQGVSFGRLAAVLRGVASYTLASSISWAYKSSDYDFRRVLIPHIDSCISLCKDGPIVSCHSSSDRVEMAARFALTFGENGRLWSATELWEKVLEARQTTLGREHHNTLSAIGSLAISYRDMGRRQEALELWERVLEARQRTLVKEHPDTLGAMNSLAISYHNMGRRQEALELWEMVLEANQRTL